MTQHPTGSYNVTVPFLNSATVNVRMPDRLSPIPFAGFRVKAVTGNFVSATPRQHFRVISRMLASYGANYLHGNVSAAGEIINSSIIAQAALDALGGVALQQDLMDAPLVFFHGPVALPYFDISLENHLGVPLPIAPGNELTVHLDLIQVPSLSHHR